MINCERVGCCLLYSIRERKKRPKRYFIHNKTAAKIAVLEKNYGFFETGLPLRLQFVYMDFGESSGFLQEILFQNIWIRTEAIDLYYLNDFCYSIIPLAYTLISMEFDMYSNYRHE